VSLTPAALYRRIALAEMVTWTLLIIAMVARYGFGYDGGLFFVAGLSHGIIFIAYCISAIVVGLNLRWRVGTIILACVLALPPWATYPFDRWLEKRGMLEGAWRLDKTDDPRDDRALDRLLRWWLARPVLFFFTIVLGMAVVITTLLSIGPPTQWGSGA
jgi:integral membrane protein